jgi:thymidylate synthase (FAD)
MESSTPKIDVLNHGFVRLVSYMQPVPETHTFPGNTVEYQRVPEDWTGDLEVVRNARVSYDADWRTGDSEFNDRRLMGTIINEDHTSPLEAMVFTFEVQVPIFITRQWHRHRTWSYNEVSARYAELPDVFFLPELDRIGAQSKDNKQMSTYGELTEDEREKLKTDLTILGADLADAYDSYQELIKQGWPRERARTVLPLAIYTRFFATVDLHNLFHFLRLRLHEHAQYEIRVYAQAMLELITPIVPVAVELFRHKRAETEMIDKIRKLCKDNKFDTVEVFTNLLRHAESMEGGRLQED